MNIIMDVFQGWYKDGTNGTRDYRALSALYMVLRLGIASELILVFLFQFKTPHNSLEWTLPCAVHIGLGCFYLVAKPYKKNWMNVVDGLVLVLLGLCIGIILVYDDYVLLLNFLLSTLPSIVAVGYLIYRLFKRLKFATLRRLRNHFNTTHQAFDEGSFIERRLVQSDDNGSVQVCDETEIHQEECHNDSMLIDYGTF